VKAIEEDIKRLSALTSVDETFLAHEGVEGFANAVTEPEEQEAREGREENRNTSKPSPSSQASSRRLRPAGTAVRVQVRRGRGADGRAEGSREMT